MKRVFWTSLLALPLLAAPAQANGFGFKFNLGGSLYGNLTPLCGGCPGGGGPCGGVGGGGGQLGPWYSYWPLDAHFQTPALPQYPYWPSPQDLYQGPSGGPPAAYGVPYGTPYGAPYGT